VAAFLIPRVRKGTAPIHRAVRSPYGFWAG
jgi:hypothetical protein